MKKNPANKWRTGSAALPIIVIFAFLLTACEQSHTASVTPPQPANAAAATAHDSHATAPETKEVAQKIPHYFENPDDAKPFPKTLDPATMKTTATKLAYATARRIPEVLAQQPCYCFCDRGFGHGSLLDCHIDNHSAD